jgi:hypothetical protein
LGQEHQTSQRILCMEMIVLPVRIPFEQPIHSIQHTLSAIMDLLQ